MDVRDESSRIKPSDAASMLRKQVKANTPPYQAAVTKMNNALVDEWKREVLDQVAVDGTIDASMVWDSWSLFHEGKIITELMTLLKDGTLRVPSDGDIEYWRVYLAKASIEDLHKLGSATVALIWTEVNNYIRVWFAKQKWQRVYSKSSSPLAWEHLRVKERGLFHGEEFPVWNKEQFEEVAEKVRTILTGDVRVEGVSGVRTR